MTHETRVRIANMTWRATSAGHFVADSKLQEEERIENLQRDFATEGERYSEWWGLADADIAPCFVSHDAV
jgi:hypothetical protein